MRSIAQKRFTAVGRVAAISAHMASNAAWSAVPSAASRRTPRASPSAAVTPMAGAPRTAMSRMASRHLVVVPAAEVDLFAGQQPLVDQHHRLVLERHRGDHRTSAKPRS